MRSPATPVCATLHCTAHHNVVNARRRVQGGATTIVGVSRMHVGRKLLRQVTRPVQFGRQNCVAILAHEGASVRGHWFAFVLLGNTWWRVDTNRQNAVQQNPFDNQNQGNSRVDTDFTLDFIFFK